MPVHGGSCPESTTDHRKPERERRQGRPKKAVSYDLSDPEEGKLEAMLKVSDDNGQTYLVDVSKASGDVGYPVNPGKAKLISWSYPGTEPPPHCKIKLIADDRYQINLGDVIGEVDSTRLRANLSFLTGVRSRQKAGRRHLNVVRDTLESAFRPYGLQA
jgi:hypothetical protein